jgi:hypothetical protein
MTRARHAASRNETSGLPRSPLFLYPVTGALAVLAPVCVFTSTERRRT